jgi:hypothetical protein
VTSPSASQLLYHLGGDAFVPPVPSGAGDDVQQIGALAGLPVWTLTAGPIETLRRARRLARHGALGVLIGFDPVSEQWLVAVTIQPVRLALVPVGEPDALPLRRLERAARAPRATPLEQAIALAEALDVDAAGRRTFRLLHELLDRAVSLLPGTVARDDRHAWALAQITRLLFLRFVESEGWLDGNPRFLADAFDRCLTAKRDPMRHLLHPLFFGTLNRSWEERSRFARAFGAVPFLNGGLFEPHAIERQHRLRLPVDYWHDAFAALVDRVDVTLDASADDGRVTPELLGRVFEGVMHPVERKQQGAFFTPPALVDALLRQALACHLAPKLGRSEEAIERSLDDPDGALRRILLDVTVLDPAVGSGAFLVGALGLLHGPGPRQPARVRHLVTRRLFGVDRHPGAVRLCELRLWLEVLRAMRGRPAGRVPPLPNLDARVRAGDALIDPLHGTTIDAAAARRIRAGQRAILGAHGATKRAAISDARRTERAAVLRALRAQEAVIDREIAELFAAARAPTLFGDRPRVDPVRRRDIAARRRQRTQLRTERRRLVRDASTMPFAINAAFAPVTTGRGGFDLVVGNPPWVRAEQLPAVTRDALATRYRWWHGGTGPGWRHLPDLCVAFVERGFSLLAPGGTLSFLVPAKLATAGYATACRSGLVARSTIHRVADLGRDPRASFEATTYPLAIIASRRLPPAGHTVRLGLRSDDPAQPQAAWQDASGWLTASPDAQRVAARLAREHPCLSELITPQLGVKTGANTAFLDPPDELRAWCRPAVRGRDVRAFTATPGAMLLWPADARGTPWPHLPPALAEYLGREMVRLQRRADQQDGPWWQLFRTRAATAPHRVIWRDLSPELQAAVIQDDDAVPLNSCYVAAVSSTAVADSLAAWLNATPIRAIARMRAEPAAGGCARFAARTLGSLPLPRGVLGHPALASLTHTAADRDVQSALDECVSELLDLSINDRDALVAVAKNRR